MSKTRLFVDEPIKVGTNIELRGDQARYVGRVLRMRPGDALTLFNGEGAEYRASIETFSKDLITTVIEEETSRSAESPLRITLIQGISRGDRMDFAIQKATELGVAGIQPILTEYSVVRLEPKRAGKKQAHWRNVAASACEQCGRNQLPFIDAPTTFLKMLETWHDSPVPRLILQPGATQTLKSFDLANGEAVILVGPEGGFSELEYENAGVAGFQSVGFGPRVLRTETAALAAIAALQTLYGDLA
jgi:16S rRNA (uracil1498-N3)-methyltransferase